MISGKISNISSDINNIVGDRNNKMNNICCFGCGVHVYWNPVKGEYWELSTQKKHKCPYLEKGQIQKIEQ